MTGRNRKVATWLLAFELARSAVLTTDSQAADIQLQVQAAPGAQASPSPTGKLLTLEEAVRIGLDNHPRIKSANERVLSQEAILGQQMSAYYPTISLNNQYRTSYVGSASEKATASENFISQALFSMTLYNLASARHCAGSTRNVRRGAAGRCDHGARHRIGHQDRLLHLSRHQAFVNVAKGTVRNRELLVRQARGFRSGNAGEDRRRARRANLTTLRPA
jgi:hypothetical protein